MSVRAMVHGDSVRFRNGNMNIRFTSDEIKQIESGRVSDIEVLSWVLEELDCEFLGDEFCLSNYEMGCLIYSYYFDKVYLLRFTDIEEVLLKGKSLKLYGKDPDEDEREMIDKEWLK